MSESQVPTSTIVSAALDVLESGGPLTARAVTGALTVERDELDRSSGKIERVIERIGSVPQWRTAAAAECSRLRANLPSEADRAALARAAAKRVALRRCGWIPKV